MHSWIVTQSKSINSMLAWKNNIRYEQYHIIEHTVWKTTFLLYYTSHEMQDVFTETISHDKTEEMHQEDL